MDCFGIGYQKQDLEFFVVDVLIFERSSIIQHQHFVLFRHRFVLAPFLPQHPVFANKIFNKLPPNGGSCVSQKDTGYDASQNKYMASLMAFFRRVR